MKKIKILVCLFISLTVLSSCSKDKSNYNPHVITVNGGFNFQKFTLIPDDAKVYVVWGVGTASEYDYVYGEGKLNKDKSSYTISFDDSPPSIALNRNRFGVGTVVITDGTELEEGILDQTLDFSSIILGASTTQAIFYKTESTKSLQMWAAGFPPGFMIADGMDENSDEVDDFFVPSMESELEVEINDFNALEFVQWR